MSITSVSIKGLTHRYYSVIFLNSDVRFIAKNNVQAYCSHYIRLHLWVCVLVTCVTLTKSQPLTLVFSFGKMRQLLYCEIVSGFYGLYTLSSLEHIPSMCLKEPATWQTLKYLLSKYLNLYS